ncbi:MAG: Gfo/Idh/MocA family oxidoreductase [Candidatus Lokiarchaeota archaeon]|nr:Gfo/Idh/MocA family oxidoreductase [Candidatus Lokiarchaeota archaeon]
MNLPITAVLLGAGRRGFHVYGNYALKEKKKLKFIAVAEPIKARREKFANLHRIPSNRCYESWEDLLSQDKLANVAFICTQDQMHTEPTLLALEKGYHVLLEKPMAQTLENCIKIVKKVEETGRILGVGHVLRYTSFFSTIYKIIQKGLLGDIVNISHRENVMWYHYAHSFIRGPWSNVEKSSPMILAKCCHDLDLLFHMTGSLPKKISSFGNLYHFKPENAPKGAPEYCLDGCPAKAKCLYYAPRIYIDIIPQIQFMEKSDNKFLKILGKLRKNHVNFLTYLSKLVPLLKELRYYKDFPIYYLYTGQKEDYSDEAKARILKKSPYGRCVYHCDNDVVDHQIVNIEFENGVTANLTMHGFSEREGRTLRIDGTKATLIGEFYISGEKIIFYDHFSGKETLIYTKKLTRESGEHGVGDFELVDDYIESLISKEKTQPLTNAQETVESHLMAFAANESRLKGIVVDMNEFRKKAYKLG